MADKKNKNEKNKNEKDDLDNVLEELFMVLMGHVMIENTKHNPELNKIVRKKVIKELENTNLFKETIVRATKEN